jgi:hypothetical protein
MAYAHPGVGIVMDSKGNVFYTDLIHVWKIATDGKVSIAVKNVHTHELYIDSGDNLYGEHEWYEGEATDRWGNYVWCLTPDGDFRKTIPDVEGILENNTLVRDPEGNSYWADRSGDQELLKKQTFYGENLLVTDHSFDDIRWMHFSGHDGNLYVVDHLQLKKVTADGNVTVIADNLKEDNNVFGVSDRHYIYGVWTDLKRNVFVAVYGSGEVKKISENGAITTIFESGMFWAPCGGLIAPDGSQWIMEFSKNNKTRIRKISADGKHTLFSG